MNGRYNDVLNGGNQATSICTGSQCDSKQDKDTILQDKGTKNVNSNFTQIIYK